MPSESQYGQTLLISDFDHTPAETLKRVPLEKTAGQSGKYTEAWLQKLVMRQPTLLPVEQIETAFVGLVPICMELPLASGSVDNLLVTPSGNIALVECKLWRNPQARREVVGQIIDYATEISRWSYEQLEHAIARTAPVDGAQNGHRNSLFARVASTSEIDEAEFIDRVSRNLRLGRFLLLIVGDGIQEGVLGMGEYLQRHAGLHFTLGIVEIAIFQLPTGSYVAQPRLFARTTNVDRGIVTFDDARISISLANSATSALAAPVRTMPITKEQWIESIENHYPGISADLNAFIDELPTYHVNPEFGTRSMILRWHGDDMKEWNLGTIALSGDIWTEHLYARVRAAGLTDQFLQYLENIRALVPGAAIKNNPVNGHSWLVDADGRQLRIGALLADARRIDGWLQAIATFQSAVAQAA